MRRAVRHLLRRLGLPPLSGRSWMVALVVFLALMVVATLIGDFLLKFGGYGPHYYEPKDFQREEQVQKESAKPPAVR